MFYVIGAVMMTTVEGSVVDGRVTVREVCPGCRGTDADLHDALLDSDEFLLITERFVSGEAVTQ